MDQQEMIGKVAVYRPLFTRDLLRSKVVSVEPLVRFDGRPVTMLHLENGDSALAESVYFSRE